MNNTGEPTDGRFEMPGAPKASEVLSSHAVDRRRALLKGVGRGSALLAATVPLKTLAGQGVLTTDLGHQCTVSGMQSGVHSAAPSSQVCKGYAPCKWGQSSDNCKTPSVVWPTLPKTGCTHTTMCSSVFNNCKYRNSSLLQVLNNYPNSDDAHWVCAWLNACASQTSMGSTLNFPYTPDQVMAYYNCNDPVLYNNALTFFKGYMETLQS